MIDGVRVKVQSDIFFHKISNRQNDRERQTNFLMAFSSTPLSLSEDFCTQSYSADDIVALVMSYIDPTPTQMLSNFERLKQRYKS